MLRPVLVVEDDQNDLELTLIALERARMANPVIAVRDGQEALNYLLKRAEWAGNRDAAPAFILLDIKMPRINGLETLRATRSLPRLRHVPVVVMSSSRMQADVTHAYDHGANAYVVKPIEFDAYSAAIRDIAVMWGIRNQLPDRLAA